MFGRTFQRIKSSRPVRLVLALQSRYGKESAGQMAAAISYYAFFAVLALFALAVAILGFVLAGNPGAQRRLAHRIAGSVPGIGSFLGKNIHFVAQGRVVTLIVGLVGLLLTGLGLVQSAGWALGKVFRVEPYGGIIKPRLWALGSLAVLGSIALVSTFAASAVAAVHLSAALAILLTLVGAVVSLGLDFLLFLVAYRILLQRRGPAWRKLWAGALLAGAGWTGLKLLGSWYVARTIAKSSAVYGGLATFAAILGFLYLAARLFMYGAVLNAVLIDGTWVRTVGEGSSLGGDEVAQPAEKHPPIASESNGREQRSTGELMKAIAGDTATLVRKEVELARREIQEGILARLKAAGALGAAGAMGLLALVFLGAAAASGLALAIPRWAAWLVVGGAFLLLAGGAAGFGLLRMKRPSLAPEETKRTVREDVEWARAQLKR